MSTTACTLGSATRPRARPRRHLERSASIPRVRAAPGPAASGRGRVARGGNNPSSSSSSRGASIAPRAIWVPPEELAWIPDPETVFNVENVAIFPLWLGMIFAPKSGVTRAVMDSALVPCVCGFVYVYLTWYSFHDPRILDAFSTGKPDLAALAKGFSYEWCVAVGWAHFIAMDLFAGRWIYLDARKNDVFAAHSLLLCLFFGPTGAISHVTTRAITGLVRGEKLVDVMAAGGEEKASASE
jgi:hypothetical protein